jgi:hypothetical protein
MKISYVLVIGSLVLMSFSAMAADVSIQDYQSELSDKLENYDGSFDDCFGELTESFPDLSVSISELSKWVLDLDVDTWYHRSITYLGQPAEEAFFIFKTEMEYFAIRIIYFINDEDSTISLNKVDFYGTMSGLESEFGYMFSIPNGVTEKSLEEIAACVESTPGFEMVFVISSIMAVLVLVRKRKENKW